MGSPMEIQMEILMVTLKDLLQMKHSNNPLLVLKLLALMDSPKGFHLDSPKETLTEIQMDFHLAIH